MCPFLWCPLSLRYSPHKLAAFAHSSMIIFVSRSMYHPRSVNASFGLNCPSLALPTVLHTRVKAYPPHLKTFLEHSVPYTLRPPGRSPADTVRTPIDPFLLSTHLTSFLTFQLFRSAWVHKLRTYTLLSSSCSYFFWPWSSCLSFWLPYSFQFI